MKCNDKNCFNCSKSSICPEVKHPEQVPFKSKAKENARFLKHLLAGLTCGIEKAFKGSDVEDDYILEKLGKIADTLGYKLVKKSEV
jgi:hypothetical protein